MLTDFASMALKREYSKQSLFFDIEIGRSFEVKLIYVIYEDGFSPQLDWRGSSLLLEGRNYCFFRRQFVHLKTKIQLFSVSIFFLFFYER